MDSAISINLMVNTTTVAGGGRVNAQSITNYMKGLQAHSHIGCWVCGLPAKWRTAEPDPHHKPQCLALPVTAVWPALKVYLFPQLQSCLIAAIDIVWRQS